MKKTLAAILLFGVELFASAIDETKAESLIVKDLNRNRIIHQKDENQIIAPASLTKIMTAVIALKTQNPNTIVTITPEMVNVEPTKANIKVGEKFYMIDLIKAAMIGSSNDAAKAIAVHVGGSEEKFAKVMNAYANKIGMNSSNFTNACGFDIGNHYSTAKDLLKLAEHAMSVRGFNNVVAMRAHNFRALNTKRVYKVGTSNKLLGKYAPVVGIKTGYTHKAGPCYIGRAKKGKEDLLVVMLNSKNRWKSAQAIFDELFDKHMPHTAKVITRAKAPNSQL